MDECPVDLGRVHVEDLKAALTCFPSAQSLDIRDCFPEIAEKKKWVKLLRRHGGTFKRVTAQGKGGEKVLSSAVRAGALPNLNYYRVTPWDSHDRQLLADGKLSTVEEVCVDCLEDADCLATLELLRDLPCLRGLSLTGGFGSFDDVVLPAFIPPSLKTLTIECVQAPLLETLMRSISSTSGANLEEVRLKDYVTLSAEGGAALARVFRTCSSTLKTVHIFSITDPREVNNPAAIASEVALGLESCCETLEDLEVPWGAFSSLPPTCPPFKRLTHLHLGEGPSGAIDLTSPVWDLVARGLLPTLADLSLGCYDFLWVQAGEGEEGVCRLICALEGVAGTLTRLALHNYGPAEPSAATCHELGLAIGKLWRLNYLSLRLSKDGRSYKAVGRGLAASGGCPRLSELHLGGVSENFNFLTLEPSLIVPSVRDLHLHLSCSQEDALLFCCGLVRFGYKHRLSHNLYTRSRDSCLAAVLEAGGIRTVP
jgi:hypothetical protein